MRQTVADVYDVIQMSLDKPIFVLREISIVPFFLYVSPIDEAALTHCGSYCNRTSPASCRRETSKIIFVVCSVAVRIAENINNASKVV